jgi:polysaccharide export outer membrane protein
MDAHLRARSLAVWAALGIAAASGCLAPVVRTHPGPAAGPAGDVARELDMVTLPPYRIGPTDSLVVEAVRVIPKSPYRIEPQDVLTIMAAGVLPDAPIANQFPVQPDGTVDLGTSYGSVKLLDLTLDEARMALKRHLDGKLKRYGLTPDVSISLAQAVAVQQIEGEHTVGPDGTIIIGVYGKVYVNDMTLVEATAAIESHLEQWLEMPKVGVEVFALNSKSYKVILDTPTRGQQIVTLPSTGNDTVLDAIAQVQGLTPFSSRDHIWVARPSPGSNCDQILPVSWNDIVRKGATETNYQLFPGDRLFVQGHPLQALDNFVDRLFSPAERLFGTTLLGTQTIQQINRLPDGNRFLP